MLLFLRESAVFLWESILFIKHSQTCFAFLQTVLYFLNFEERMNFFQQIEAFGQRTAKKECGIPYSFKDATSLLISTPCLWLRSLKRSAVCFSRGTVFLSQKRCLHGENMRIWVNVETLEANKHTFWEWPFQKVQTVTLRSSPKAENHTHSPFSKRCFLNHQNMGSLWHCFNMS